MSLKTIKWDGCAAPPFSLVFVLSVVLFLFDCGGLTFWPTQSKDATTWCGESVAMGRGEDRTN